MASGADLDVGADETFAALRGEPSFQSLVRRADAARAETGRVRVAFRLTDSQLVPEGIAYDPVERTFFVGSIAERKVVAIDRRGRSSDFAGPDRGLLQVLGMAVDQRRRLLWVATSAGRAMGERTPHGGVIALALPEGRVVRRPTDR